MSLPSNFLAEARPLSSRPGPDWLQVERATALESAATRGLPRAAEEIWRYSRIDQLELGAYHPVPEGAPMAIDQLPAAVQDVVSAAGPEATVLVSHNGGPAEVIRPQPGLSVGPADGPLFGEASLPGLGGPPPDTWSELNDALAGVPWRVAVKAGATLAAPVVVVHWVDGDGSAVFPRVEIALGDNANAQVVEVVASDGADVVVAPLARMSLGPGSHLGFAHLQLLGPSAWQFGNQVSRVDRDASLRSMTVSLGGSYARVRADSVLIGPGGETELLAAYFGSGHQMHDLRTVQHHAAPKCRSDLLFKGVVADRAHSVYSGLIRVEKGAKGTNAFQTNRNLVLSEGAQADSVPNLEIEDNDVRCSHASAVGPVDESQLFYLESRGVPTLVAERLVALGFLDDVLERVPVPGLLGWLRGQMAAKLASAGFSSPDGPQS